VLILPTTNDVVRVVTGQAVTVDVHASYVDSAVSGITPGRTNTAISTATTTTVVPAPASGAVRNVKLLTVRNKGASSVDVTVQAYDGATAYELFKWTLAAGDTLQYTDEGGFIVVASGRALSLNLRVFTASGTYTPSPGLVGAIIECVGGGGGGGGTAAPGTFIYCGSGGGAGSYSRRLVTAAQIGASQTVTIGAQGNGGAAGNNNGTAGSDTSVGTLCIGKGGQGGVSFAGNNATNGGLGGIAGTGDFIVPGNPGGAGGFTYPGSQSQVLANYGGASFFGGAGQSYFAAFNAASTSAQLSAVGYGSGGAGAVSHNATASAGGNGSPGVCIITEYIGSGAAGGLARLGGRLSYSSATALLFTPFNGNQIQISGTLFTIPTAGIAGLANTSVFVNGIGASNLAASTTYYVYAFNNAGTVTADFRTDGNGHITDTTAGNEGVEVRCSAGTTPDPTRTLIGMIRTNASSQFADATANRLVISWFNRRGIGGTAQLTADRAVASATMVEVHSEIRTSFLTWGNEDILAGSAGGAAPGAAASWVAGLSIDGAAPSQQTSNFSSVGGAYCTVGITAMLRLSEGLHYVTLMGASVGAVSTTFVSTDTAQFSICRTWVRTSG
jgi:hypothetical protein